jgi:uncharacterized cupredoxin-like copper-binding protein
MWNPRAALFAGLTASVLFVGGCGGSGKATDAGASGPSITVTGTDAMKYDPDTINVKAGQPVTIVFKNGGIIAHDFVTTGGDTNVKLTGVGSGRQQTGTFEANKPGTYQFVCNQPGHKEAGMVGKIVVS